VVAEFASVDRSITAKNVETWILGIFPDAVDCIGFARIMSASLACLTVGGVLVMPLINVGSAAKLTIIEVLIAAKCPSHHPR
jgi:hypothetical protein